MGSKTQKRGLSGNPGRRASQLDEAATARVPRCQCEHRGGRCGGSAAFRVSALCAEPGCNTAVHVILMCVECKEEALARHDAHCGDRHRLRVTAL